MNLGGIVKQLLATSDEQISRQLKYISDQLDSEKVEECFSDSNETVIEEDENYETEGEEEVDVEIVNAGVQTGEQLLLEFADQSQAALESMSGCSPSRPNIVVKTPATSTGI